MQIIKFLNQEKYYIMFTLIAMFVLSAFAGRSGNPAGWVYCLQGEHTAKYFMDSWCSDMNYRCNAECSNYGLEFTGIIDGCACDCGTGWVSSCSGFYYDKESDTVLARYTGDEICEYGNGTVEPCGYEAGIENITDRILR